MYNEDTIKELERIAGKDKLATIAHTLDISSGKRSGYYGCFLHVPGSESHSAYGIGNTPEEALENLKNMAGIA